MDDTMSQANEKVAQTKMVGQTLLDAASGDYNPTSVMNDADLLVSDVNIHDWLEGRTVQEARNAILGLEHVYTWHMDRAKMIDDAIGALRDHLAEVQKSTTRGAVPTRG